MVRILTEPRDALVRQYRKLFAYDGVELVVEDEALAAVGREALGRGCGARGLRSVMERVLAEAMFEVPSMSGIRRVIIGEGCVTRGESPAYEFTAAAA
jgi:ATP-dependent Clp protease ATP-binding subunit ClpX